MQFVRVIAEFARPPGTGGMYDGRFSVITRRKGAAAKVISLFSRLGNKVLARFLFGRAFASAFRSAVQESGSPAE